MKKLFLFPVMLLFALTITACSNSPNGFEEPETEQTGNSREMMVTKIINQKRIV